jgi:hypothetical protein
MAIVNSYVKLPEGTHGCFLWMQLWNMGSVGIVQHVNGWRHRKNKLLLEESPWISRLRTRIIRIISESLETKLEKIRSMIPRNWVTRASSMRARKPKWGNWWQNWFSTAVPAEIIFLVKWWVDKDSMGDYIIWKERKYIIYNQQCLICLMLTNENGHSTNKNGITEKIIGDNNQHWYLWEVTAKDLIRMKYNELTATSL